MVNRSAALDTIEVREAMFWDDRAKQISDQDIRTERLNMDRLVQATVDMLGTVRDKCVLDVGCGTGLWSTFLAEQGAEVWAIDISPESIAVTQRRAELNKVGHRVHASVMSAIDLKYSDSQFDIIYGQNIIHHLPAGEFGREIWRVLRPGGHAVFQENNANNKLLMFARDNFCGRFGIPKWSSDDEYPLTVPRLQEFACPFNELRVQFPQFHCFNLFNAKLFKYNSRPINWLCSSLDQGIYSCLPMLRKYSYRQVIRCQK